ncbi:MAG TPA: hypothetical protein VEC58_07135, partial [Roseiarcus sp.]|nr:hypothetical protein [Roseiarcus sp.]
MARDRNGKWFGDIFDGIGCLEAFRNHDLQFKNQRVMLLGAGGAGRAIGVAVAYEGPEAITIYDIDERRAAQLAETVATIDPKIRLSVRTPVVENID